MHLHIPGSADSPTMYLDWLDTEKRTHDSYHVIRHLCVDLAQDLIQGRRAIRNPEAIYRV